MVAVFRARGEGWGRQKYSVGPSSSPREGATRNDLNPEQGAGCCVLAWGVEEPTVFDSSIIRVCLNRVVTASAFYVHNFTLPAGKVRIRSIVVGSTITKILGSHLQRIEVNQLSLDVRGRIVIRSRTCSMCGKVNLLPGA